MMFEEWVRVAWGSWCWMKNVFRSFFLRSSILDSLSRWGFCCLSAFVFVCVSIFVSLSISLFLLFQQQPGRGYAPTISGRGYAQTSTCRKKKKPHPIQYSFLLHIITRSNININLCFDLAPSNSNIKSYWSGTRSQSATKNITKALSICIDSCFL